MLALQPLGAKADVVGYSITVTTAYAAGDPFPNRLDQAFTEPDTGYLQIANTGNSMFSGIVGTIAVSAFAGDLSFTSGPIVLAPDGSVSIAIPDDSNDVGGFNGPNYFFRPGVEITLNGTIADGALSEPVALLVADADIHSGVWRTDNFGLSTDSFVLQGGDPWGFQTNNAFALSQADGVYVFSQPDSASAQAAPEPASLGLLGVGVMGLWHQRRRRMLRFPAG